MNTHTIRRYLLYLSKLTQEEIYETIKSGYRWLWQDLCLL